MTRVLLFLALAISVASGCTEGTTGVVLGEAEDSTSAGGLGGAAAGDGGLQVGSGGGSSGGASSTWWTEACRPTVSFENLDATETGQDVEVALGDPETLVQSVAQSVCRVLYRDPSEVPDVGMIHLVLDPSASAGAVSSSTIRLETTYLGSFGSSAAIQEEARGMLHFFVAHLYQRGVDQTPSWLVSGKADFVRLSAGLLAGSSPAPGGTWTDGFRTTAFFLAHIEESHPDFVYSLNLKMAAEGAVHDDAWFEELTGTNLSALWDAYQASF